MRIIRVRGFYGLKKKRAEDHVNPETRAVGMKGFRINALSYLEHFPKRRNKRGFSHRETTGGERMRSRLRMWIL